ncbi:MAG: class I SAM-dependent methyltransferase [Acidimicrobiales bacterium]|nr:class I SAM-dependent methyltransferase [Acidimicrobiales bacterium]
MPWVLNGEGLAGEVLEIGAGAGANTAALAAAHPRATITASDIDPVMVGAARARLTNFGTQVTVQQADTTRLPFEAGRFDATVSLLMLHHVVDWQRAITEVARVLRPGGRFLGYDLTASRSAKALHLADRSAHQLINPYQLRHALEEARFVDITVTHGLGRLVARFDATKP